MFACAAEYLHCTLCANESLRCTCAKLVISQLLGPPRFRQCPVCLQSHARWRAWFRATEVACAAEYLHCTSCADQHLCCTCAVLFSVQIAALLQLTSVILQLLGPPRFRQCQPRLLSPVLAATLMLCLPQAAASSWLACSPQSAQSPLGPRLTPMEGFV